MAMLVYRRVRRHNNTQLQLLDRPTAFKHLINDVQVQGMSTSNEISPKTLHLPVNVQVQGHVNIPPNPCQNPPKPKNVHFVPRLERGPAPSIQSMKILDLVCGGTKSVSHRVQTFRRCKYNARFNKRRRRLFTMT